MNPLRLWPAESAVNLDVNGGAHQPLLGANNMGDTHIEVVTHGGQMVGGKAVRFEQDFIVQFAIFEGDCPAQKVLNYRFTLERNLEPHHVTLSPIGTLLGLERVQGAVTAVITSVLISPGGSGSPHLLEFFGSFKA